MPEPSHSSEINSPYSERLHVFDLKNGRIAFLREVPPSTVSKAEQLSGVFQGILETGSIDITGLTILNSEIDPNGLTLDIEFNSYSQALADCVFIACSRFGGFIWKDRHNGFFSIWLRTSQSMTQCGIAE